MKGKIDKRGILWLQRGKSYREQRCPYTMKYMQACGDWCALFSEPEESAGDEIELSLCHTFHIFKKEDFKDER